MPQTSYSDATVPSVFFFGTPFLLLLGYVLWFDFLFPLIFFKGLEIKVSL